MLNNAKKTLSPFEQGVQILEADQKRYLIYKTKCFEAIRCKGEWLYFVVFYPVLNDVKHEIQSHSMSGVKSLILKNIGSKGSTFVGETDKGESIQLLKDCNALNVQKHNEFLRDFKS